MADLFKIQKLPDGRGHMHIPGDFIVTMDGGQGITVTLLEKKGFEVTLLPMTGNFNYLNLCAPHVLQIGVGTGQVKIENAQYPPTP